MAKTIDQRVVEMQFDNKNFEKNVSQSMSTLEKLKEKLNFRGASKAMDELNNSMKGINTSPISSALDKVGGGFSALEQIAIGSLRKIGEQAVATGEKLIKSLTTDNIAAGWQKFGDKTTSVATLVAQGYDIEKVEEELEKLNFFTDETSYNFVDMVGNIGKFTAAGQGLEESLTAMQGIATWAALSGQNAATASRAMYQLSQAMGSGMMRKEDYKSIQNASMDTQEFRQRALDAAEAMGLLEVQIENGQKIYKSKSYNPKDASKAWFTIDQFADHLTEDAWFTSDVMMMIYKDYGKASNTLIKYLEKNADELSTASEAMDDIEARAQELLDSGKASSFDEALQKVSLEELANIPELYDEAMKFADEYNSTLADGEKRIDNVYDALVEMGYGIDEFSLKAFRAAQEARTWADVLDSVKDAVSTGWMNTFQGIFGNQEEATKLWTRLANDFWDIFASSGEDRNNVLGLWNEYIDPAARNTSKFIQSTTALRDMLAANTTSGRDLLFSTDENNLGAIISLLQTLKDLLGIIKDAWNETFYGTTDADEIAWKKADMLMAITNALKAFADMLTIDDEKSDKLRRTFKGLFAILGIIKDFVGKAFIAVWKSLASMFGDTNVDILDMTASIGDNIVAFREWLDKNNVFEKAFEGIGTAISNVVGFLKNLIDQIKAIPFVSNIIDKVSAGFENFSGYVQEGFNRIRDGEGIGTVFSDIFNRVVDSLKNTSEVFKFVVNKFNAVKDFFTNLFSNIGGGKDIGTKLSEIGDAVKNGIGGVGDIFINIKNAISDFWNGTSENLQNAKNGIGTFVENVKNLLSQINGERIIKLISGAAIFVFLFRMIGTVKTFFDFFGGIGEAIETVANTISKVGKSIQKATKNISKAISENLRAKALVSVATAVLMLVGAITALYFMAENPDKLILAGSILAGLVVALIGLSIAASKSKGLTKMSLAIASVGGSLLVLVLAINMLSNVANTGGGWNAVGMIAVLSVIIAAIVAFCLFIAKKLSTIDQALGIGARLKAMALMVVSFAGSVLVLALAANLLAKSDTKGIIAATAAIGVLVGALAALIVLTSIFKNSNFKGLGLMLLEIAASLVVFAAGITLFSLIPEDVFTKGAVRVAQVGAIFAALIAVSMLSGEHASSAGSMILKMSVAFALMIGVIKLISFITDEELKRGTSVIAVFSLICAGLVAVSKLAGNAAAKAGLMLLEMSAAMVILTGVIYALSYLPTEGLAKAAIAVAGLMVVFGLLIGISKMADEGKDITKTLIVLTVAVVALAGSVFALGMLDGNNVLKAAGAMGAVLLAFSAVIAMARNIKKGLGVLIVLTVAVAAIGTIIYLLGSSDNNADNAIKNAAGIAVLFTAMAGVLFILTKIGDMRGKYAQLFAMVGAMALLSLVAGLLTSVFDSMKTIDGDAAIKQAAAISVLLVAMGAIIAGVAALGGVIGKGGTNTSLGSLGGLAAGVIALWALSSLVLPSIANAIVSMNGIDASSAISSAAAISMLLIAMTGVVATLALLGAVAGGVAGSGVGATIGIGAGIGAAAGLLIGIIALNQLSEAVKSISLIIVGMSSLNGDAAIKYAEALSSFLESMVGILLQFSLVGILAAPAITGVAVMIITLSAIGLLAAKIGELMNQAPELQRFIDEGIPVLNQLAQAIGSIFGNIVGGFIQGVGANIIELLPLLGLRLTEFSIYVTPFLETMRQVKPEDLQNANLLVSAIVLLTAAEFINGIIGFLSFMSGGTSMTSFATSLESLGKGVAKFSEAVNGKIYPEPIESAVEALRKLVDIESSINVITSLVATADLSLFASQMGYIGKGLADFSTEVNGHMYPQQNEYAFSALRKLIDIQGSVNVITSIASALNLSAFASQMGYIGNGLADFSTNVNGKIYPQQNEYAFTALSKLVAIQGSVNVITAIASSASLSMFASQMGYIGNGLADFSAAVNGKIFKEDNENAIDALGKLVNIGGSMNIISAISQAEGLEYFAKNMQDVGWGIVDFSVAVSGRVNKTDTDTAIGIIERLATIESGFDIISKLIGINGLDKFSENLPSIGTAIADFSKNVNGNIYPVANEQAFTALSRLSTISKDLGGDGFGFISMIANLSALDMFASNMPFIGKGIGGFISGIGGSLGTSMVRDAASNAITVLTDLAGVSKDISGGVSVFDFVDRINGMTELKFFAENLPQIGTGLGKFAEKALSIKGTEGVDASIDILKKLAEMTDLIETVADNNKMAALTATIAGYKTALADLGDAITDLATQSEKYNDTDIQKISDVIDQLAALTEKAGTVDTTKVASAMSFSSVGGMDISSLYGGMNGLDLSASGLSFDGLETQINGALGGINLSGAGTDIVSGLFGNMNSLDLSTTGLSFDGLETQLNGALGGIDLSGAGTDMLTGLFGDMNGLDLNGLGLNFDGLQETLSGALGGMDMSGSGLELITSLTSGMTGDESNAEMEQAGKDVADKFIEGWNLKQADINAVAFPTIKGLSEAIEAAAWRAKSAGEEIAKALTEGLKLKLEIASPSKVMYGLGEFAGEGFANALTDYVAITNHIGGEVGESATNGIRDALSKSADLFDTSVDVEPTIRPVLDLSGLNEGIGMIDGMFDAQRSIELAGQTKAELETYGVNIQNGELKLDNSDVITELEELRSDMRIMADKLSQFQVVMDSGALVGSLVSPMDSALGERATRRGRG